MIAVTVMAKIQPTASASETTTGRLNTYSRVLPVRRNVIGRNAARIVPVAISSGPAICRGASVAASKRDLPSLR